MASRRYRRDEDLGGTPREQLKRVTVLRRLLPLVWPYRARLAAATVVLLLGSGLSLVYPQAARRAIDASIASLPVTTLDLLALGIAVVFLVSAGATWLRHYLMSWLGERVVADLRARVYRRLLEQPLSFFHERPSGELTGRLAADVATVQGIVSGELSTAMRELVTLIGGLVLLFFESWRLTFATLAIVPPLIALAFIFGRRIRTMSRAVQDKLAESSAQAQEAVSAIATVQAFRREPREVSDYGARVDDFFRAAVHLASWRGLFIATMTLAGSLSLATLLWLGGRAIIAGTMTAGDLTAFLMYSSMVGFSLGGLASLWGSLQSAAGATARLFEILDRVPEVRDPDEPAPMPPARGTVQFERVSFAYPARRDARVLDDVSLEIGAGETLAIVGRSGAGKSTLASLLYRFFDVDEGRVLVDGVDVRHARLAELRGRLAIVAQEPVLFSGTIADNIAYARPAASAEEIERAARLAHAHEFVSAFPEAYATRIGERGVKLSGGQRQRVAIARALLADPRILILDEATSSLDGESEALVHEALQTLMRGRTTLVIAHRLSTVKDADRIVVLDAGRIVDVGSHDALVARPGIYRTLVEHQLVAA
ncbi:MAG: ATP-binding cassette domain-containing protein [Deltaproteobacteria bacterium]|nr:ATP-binding cassette domain-containing protein [Deltaproteobacteria bacterium]